MIGPCGTCKSTVMVEIAPHDLRHSLLNLPKPTTKKACIKQPTNPKPFSHVNRRTRPAVHGVSAVTPSPPPRTSTKKVMNACPASMVVVVLSRLHPATLESPPLPNSQFSPSQQPPPPPPPQGPMRRHRTAVRAPPHRLPHHQPQWCNSPPSCQSSPPPHRAPVGRRPRRPCSPLR